MFFAKLRQISLFAALVFCSSCQFWQFGSNSATNSNNSDAPASYADLESEIPFPTKEPESFQAEIIVKTDGEQEKIFVAQAGGKFFSRTGEVGVLKIDANKAFLINFEKKIYVENPPLKSSGSAVSEDSLQNFLTTEWLNQKTDAKFEEAGEENGLKKFRAAFENSETVIFFNESLKMLTRQEFYSLENGERNLVYSTELSNVKLTVDESVFQVPAGFAKVGREEFERGFVTK